MFPEENSRGDPTYYCSRSSMLNFVVFHGMESKKDDAPCCFLTSSIFKLSSAIQFHSCIALDSLSFSFWCGFNSLMSPSIWMSQQELLFVGAYALAITPCFGSRALHTISIYTGTPLPILVTFYFLSSLFNVTMLIPFCFHAIKYCVLSGSGPY